MSKQNILSERDALSIINALTMGTLQAAYPEAVEQDTLTELNEKAIKDISSDIMKGQTAELVLNNELLISYNEDGEMKLKLAKDEEREAMISAVEAVLKQTGGSSMNKFTKAVRKIQNFYLPPDETYLQAHPFTEDEKELIIKAVESWANRSTTDTEDCEDAKKDLNSSLNRLLIKKVDRDVDGAQSGHS